MDRCLDQARRGHRPGGSASVGVGRGVHHPDADQLAGSLAIAGDSSGQLACDFEQRRLENLCFDAAGSNRLIAGGSIRQHQERVVGRAVAVDGDLVEAAVGDRLDQLGHETGLDRGVGRDVGEQGRHVGVDHAGAL